jgi:hypothetical protein
MIVIWRYITLTELEKIKRAKIYMDQLAEGVDPISGDAIPDDTILNNVRLSRCFFFVSDILRQVIENNGVAPRQKIIKAMLPPFSLPNNLREQIEITIEPVMITHFTNRINRLIDENAMQKLKVSAFTKWFANNGFFEEIIVNEKRRKRPTKTGEEFGIISELRVGQYGEYLAILYNEDAQRYLVGNLDQIISISNGEQPTPGG